MKEEFVRTSQGISNLNIFHNVDYIVFLEGGNTPSENDINSTPFKKTLKKEILTGEKNDKTNDEIFWEHIFKKYAPNSKLHFKSIGSKTLLKKISEKIINGEVQNTLLAMDNEFDEALNTQIKNKSIYYTYGYSWENDVWNLELLKYIIENLSGGEVCHRIIDSIDQQFDSFMKSLKLLINISFHLFDISEEKFNGKKYIKGDKKRVQIKKELIEKDIKKYNCKKNLPFINSEPNPLRYLHGHTLEYFCTLLISTVLKANFKDYKSIGNQVSRRLALANFIKQNFNSLNSELEKYYKEQFDNNIL